MDSVNLSSVAQVCFQKQNNNDNASKTVQAASEAQKNDKPK